MTATRWIESHGVRVLADAGNIALEGLSTLTREQAFEVVTFARLNKSCLLKELEGASGLLWPMPEPGTIDTSTSAGRYACLWAIASAYGAGLMQDARGGLTLACPPMMPQEAVQAAQEGLSELAEYILVLIDRGAS